MNEQKKVCPSLCEDDYCRLDGEACDHDPYGGCPKRKGRRTMNEQKKREAMARLEGLTFCEDERDVPMSYKMINERMVLFDRPTYDSHDDCQRVFGKLSHEEKVACYDFLFEIVNGYEPNLRQMSYAELVAVAEAKPEQWVEAILRATGGWE